MLAGLAIVIPQPAAADGPSEGALRAETQAITGAVGTQLQPRREPGQYLAEPSVAPKAVSFPVQPGPQTVFAPRGALLHASPEPDSPVLNRLGVGTPVIVTHPADADGWAEVVSGGQHGYVWAPHLTPQGLPSAPWSTER